MYAAEAQNLPYIVPRPCPEEFSPGANRMLNMVGPPSWKFLLGLVALKHGVLMRDILGRGRTREIVAARHELMDMIYRHTNASTPQVGRYLGMDHTSVLYAIRKRGVTQKLVEVPGWCAAKYRPKRNVFRNGEGWVHG